MNVIASRGDRNIPIERSSASALDIGDRYWPEEIEEERSAFQFDIREIWVILRRNLLLIGAVLALSIIGGLIVTLLMTPTYVATASIEIDQQADRVLNTAEVQAPEGFQDADRFLQTQVDVLNSRAMAQRVAQKIKFVDPAGILRKMNTKIPPTKPGVSQEQQLKNISIGLIIDNLTVNLPKESRLVTISFQSPDAEFSALVANTYASEFIANNLQRKYDSSSYARDFLSKQLADTKTRLEASERDLNAYARSAGLIKTTEASPTGSSVGNGSITTASLVQLNQSANEAKSARVAAEQKWRTTSTTPLMNIPDVLGNPAIQGLLQRQADMTAKLSDELSRHRGTYPTVVQLQAQVADIGSQIQTLANNIRSSIRDQYDVARRQEQSLHGEVNSLKGATLAEQDRSVRYNILARETDTNRTMYDGLLQRFKEISAAAGVTTNNISIVDQAERPSHPSSPRLLLNMALAILLGLAVAAGLVFAKEQMDDAVRVPEDMERKLGINILGAIPLVKTGDNIIELLESPRSAISEAYHALRTSLLYSTVTSLPQTLLITSSQASEGKSTTSFAIAADLAKLDKRVLLVDTDLRRPSLHHLFGTTNDIGLSSLLTGQAGLDGAIQNTSIDNLMFIASGPIPPSPTQLLGSLRMRELLDQLGQKFDDL